MSIRIEEVFDIQAPPDRVWAYLTDPRQVVHCLPGAELTSVQDETTFLGKVKVKVGPIVTAYAGKVILTGRDDANRIVSMVGEGRESGGTGSAKMTMTSTVSEVAGGTTQVRVVADVDIVGRIAQFGRGMIESVNKQMFRQFTECVRATLAMPIAPTPAESAATPSAPSSMMPAAPAAPAGATSATPAAQSQSSAPAIAAAPAMAMPQASAQPPAPPTIAVQPVKLIPVLLAALRDYLLGLLSRLFRR
jgi:carbon monoxide dehydrogenase subunit G